ncbi:MAG: hypothetical protein C4346_18710, partial [Chloroflexota bacterium]
MPNGESKETTALNPAPSAGRALRPALAKGSFIGWVRSVKELNILLALALLCIFLSIRSDVFLTQGNLFGVARA